MKKKFEQQKILGWSSIASPGVAITTEAAWNLGVVCTSLLPRVSKTFSSLIFPLMKNHLIWQLFCAPRAFSGLLVRRLALHRPRS